MAAKDTVLGLIHDQTAKHITDYLEKVESGEAELTPAMLNAIRNFLKDNQIRCEVEETPAIQELKEKVQEEQTATFSPDKVDLRLVKGE